MLLWYVVDQFSLDLTTREDGKSTYEKISNDKNVNINIYIDLNV